MSRRRLQDILRRFKQVLAPTATAEWSDRQLLERFASQRDELAFAALVRRHGGLVLGVGRRILQHEQDAEDVYQATFLILARKAGSSYWQESIAGWLYRVAYRLAIRAKAKTGRQRAREKEAGTLGRAKAMATPDFSELYAVLDEELHRLSDQYREPLLLCYLEAKTRDQAARQLGWSLRTVERRLEQALKLLRARLSNRGVELPMALLAVGLLQQSASTNVSAAMVAATVEAAVVFGSGAMTTGGAISSPIVGLAEGGLKAMAITKLKIGLVTLAATILVATGAGVMGQRLLVATGQAKAKPVALEKPMAPPAPDFWPEGTIVKGRVVDHRGKAVAHAEVLLLGDESIILGANRKNWFIPRADQRPTNASEAVLQPGPNPFPPLAQASTPVGRHDEHATHGPFRHGL